jgi:hypothetical protein
MSSCISGDDIFIREFSFEVFISAAGVFFTTLKTGVFLSGSFLWASRDEGIITRRRKYFINGLFKNKEIKFLELAIKWRLYWTMSSVVEIKLGDFVKTG